MAIHTYAPLVTQFQVPRTGAVRRFFAALFGRRISSQPDGLAMLEREVDRIRLQSRHWLM